ncbi:MAG: hypothetical protein GVY34_11580 [Alphaproteobacteria bacterium]|jgi:hypothetical protein|nr:hypothetical protein [Alphaproteobacteria bacterium]
MKRIVATIAIATASVAGFAAPSFAGFLSSSDQARVERLTGVDASNLSASQEAFIHGMIASGELSKSDAAQRIRNVIVN